jgi:LacI family transcriptional regulator
MERALPAAVLMALGRLGCSRWRLIAEGAIERLRASGRFEFVLVDRCEDAAEHVRRRRLAGAIVRSQTGGRPAKEVARRVPAVDVSELTGFSLPDRVAVDDEAVGVMAAEYFLDRGFRRFAAAGLGQKYAVARARAFASAVGRRSFPCEILRTDPDGLERLTRLGASRGRRAAPLGVFCPDDDQAHVAIAHLLRRGVRVPGRASVVGVGDEETTSLRSEVPISSVQLPARAMGVEAAEMLLRLMAGKEAARRPALRPVRVVTRRSSDTAATDDPLVERAVAWMRDHLSEATGVPELAAVLGVSERGLHLRFARALGRGPAAVWRRLRVERAEALLLGRELEVKEIAAMCGFGGPRQFIRAFGLAHGLAPLAWRDRC